MGNRLAGPMPLMLLPVPPRAQGLPRVCVERVLKHMKRRRMSHPAPPCSNAPERPAWGTGAAPANRGAPSRWAGLGAQAPARLRRQHGGRFKGRPGAQGAHQAPGHCSGVCADLGVIVVHRALFANWRVDGPTIRRSGGAVPASPAKRELTGASVRQSMSQCSDHHLAVAATAPPHTGTVSHRFSIPYRRPRRRWCRMHPFVVRHAVTSATP